MGRISIAELWRCPEESAWCEALKHYWDFIAPDQVEIEQKMNALEVQRIEKMDADQWYRFLHDEYFPWKYTAANRLATTRKWLRTYAEAEERLAELLHVRDQLLSFDVTEIRKGLKIASSVKGLGVAGASGLLALLFPAHFGTVDQFVVKALIDVPGLPERQQLKKMNPEGLTISDGVVLIGILRDKADALNEEFGGSNWTPRQVDQILWTYGR